MSLGFKFTTFKSTANLQVSNHIWNALKRKDERKSFPTFNVSWMQIENRMKLFRHFWLRENLPVSPQSMSRVTLHFAVKYICLPLSLFLSFFLNSFLSLFLIPTSYTLSKKAKACTNYYKPFLFTPSFCLISHNGLYVFAQKHLRLVVCLSTAFEQRKAWSVIFTEFYKGFRTDQCKSCLFDNSHSYWTKQVWHHSTWLDAHRTRDWISQEKQMDTYKTRDINHNTWDIDTYSYTEWPILHKWTFTCTSR